MEGDQGSFHLISEIKAHYRYGYSGYFSSTPSFLDPGTIDILHQITVEEFSGIMFSSIPSLCSLAATPQPVTNNVSKHCHM